MCEYIIAEDFDMDKYIFDEGNGLWYELIGDYYFPCLTVPTEEEQPVGIWGQRHKRYIKEYHPALYNALLLNGRLNSYLADIDQQAQERLDTIIEQMARSQGITEALKASAMEIVNSELIYAQQISEAGAAPIGRPLLLL